MLPACGAMVPVSMRIVVVLPAAVGAEEAEDLAARHVEVDARRPR